MTSKQRAYLKSLAMTMDPILQIGKSSITPELTAAVAEALEARELIKLHVLQNCGDDLRGMAEILAERTRSQVVQVIGRKIVLYKEGNWVLDTWGLLSIDEIIFHLKVPLDGTNSDVVLDGINACVPLAVLVLFLSIFLIIGLRNKHGKPVIFLGDGVPVHKDRLEKELMTNYDIAFAPAHMNQQRAAAVGMLGIQYYKEGKTETAMEHKPDYLRVSQAEREREERLKAEKTHE